MANIRFQIIINELSIKNNYLEDGEFSVVPKFTRNYWVESGNTGFVRLIVELKNTEENAFPIDITVDITGAFTIDDTPEEQIKEYLKYQAVRVILPYARTMVTNLTTTALASPIILPLMDPAEMFTD